MMMNLKTKEDAIRFLEECAKYFETRPTGGEDRAYWANVFNAERCRNVIDILQK